MAYTLFMQTADSIKNRNEAVYYHFINEFLKALLFKGLKHVMIPNYTNRCRTRYSA
jgi:hypothetical protein